MIKKILIILLIIFTIYICIKLNKKDKIIKNKFYIHSPILNKAFYINSYNNDKISEIQLSLNRRDNHFKIVFEDNKYYLNYRNKNINELISC